MYTTMKKGPFYSIIIPKEWNEQTIEHILKDYWHAPKKLAHEWRMNKEVLLNGKPEIWTTPVKTGDELQIKLFKDEEFGVIPTYKEIDILFEDDHLIIVNKPAGIDTHPNQENDVDSLANAVAFHLLSNGEQMKIRHIHRLDHDTTGAVLFAKHAFAGALLDRMLEQREIKRLYKAIVHGSRLPKKGIINKAIGRDRHHPTKRRVSETGQKAITHYKVLDRNFKHDLAFIECQLETGRTHQIRVHLSDIGHPLLGDALYGEADYLPRQALHAYKLTFTHPFTNELIDCNAPYLDSIFDVFEE